MLLRRALYQGFLTCATLRTLVADRLSLRNASVDLLHRLGLFLPTTEQSLWVHGEGLGEFHAAGPLLRRLCDTHPGLRLVLTTSRPHTARWLGQRFPGAICLPPPWDVPGAARRFFRQLHPRLLLLLEFHDGFCPAVLKLARRAGVPVAVVNGRALPPTCPLRFRAAGCLGLTRWAAGLIDRFCLQSEVMAARMTDWRVKSLRIFVTGNLKFDVRTRPHGKKDHPILVAGCIHPEEERLILEAFAALRECHPTLSLVIGPLDLARSPAIAAACARLGLDARRRSEDTQRDASILILDTVGELADCYAGATVAVVGGSFTPHTAGHSLAEPAAHGRPIVVGPFTASQTEMVAAFRADQAVVECPAKELTSTVGRLLNDCRLREQLGERAQSVLRRQAGATERTLSALCPLLSRPVEGGLRQSATRRLALARAGQALLACRTRRLRSWTELRRRLGEPQTIVCLGNGPSSEDPRLQEFAFDHLFRVNWRWARRGFLDRPDVIFTGDYRTLRLAPRAVLGFRTIEEETLTLLNALRWPWLSRVECFTLERLGHFLNDPWPARPTNGTVMVATAAALRPRRLIVAGMDLYRHPAGKYPGDGSSTNAYAPMHERDVEVAILRRALAEFDGELVIIGDALRDALAGQECAA